MSPYQEARWVSIFFDQELAREEHRALVDSLGHEPIKIEKRVEGVLVDDENPPEEVKVEQTPPEPWEGPLPGGAKPMAAQFTSIGFEWEAKKFHGERRGNDGKLLKIPEADYCVIAFARGDQRFVVWYEKPKGGSWRFKELWDYTRWPDTIATPKKRNIKELKERYL